MTTEISTSQIHEERVELRSLDFLASPLFLVNDELVLVYRNRKAIEVSDESEYLLTILATEDDAFGGRSFLQTAVKQVIASSQPYVIHVPPSMDYPELNLLVSPFTLSLRPSALIQMLPREREVHPEAKQSLNLLVEERTAEVNELNSFLSAIVDSSTETFIIAVSSNGTILSFNEGAVQVFGYHRNEVVGHGRITNLFADPDGSSAKWSSMQKTAMETGKSRELILLRKKHGLTFDALVDCTPLINTDNQALGILFVGRDVSETLRTQRELEEKKEELEFLNLLALEIGQTLKQEELVKVAMHHMLPRFDGLIGGIYLKNELDQDLSLVAYEPQENLPDSKTLLEVTLEDQFLVEDGEVVLDEKESANGVVNRVLIPMMPKSTFLGVIVIVCRMPVKRTDELMRFLSAIATTLGAAFENAILYQDSLTKSQEIKKQNQELDEFAYVVSHDLKEPLAGISFIANMLVDEYFQKLDETGRTYISSLIDFSKRLGSLIDALLDLSRIGRITQPPESVNIDEVLHDVRQNLSFRIASKNIKLKVPSNFPVVYGDKTRIEQVFFNLLSNAIKFNDKEDILITVNWQENEPDLVEFFVRDNGIGIEPQYHEKIFKIFERLNPREEYEGNGAGLTIVKKIVEHHGGRIWLDSVLNESTTFYFTLPKFKATH